MNFSKIKTFDSFINENEDKSRLADKLINWDVVHNSQAYSNIKDEGFNLRIIKHMLLKNTDAPMVSIFFNHYEFKIDDIIFRGETSVADPLISFRIYPDGEILVRSRLNLKVNTHIVNKIYQQLSRDEFLTTESMLRLFYMIAEKILIMKSDLVKLHDYNINKSISDQINDLF